MLALFFLYLALSPLWPRRHSERNHDMCGACSASRPWRVSLPDPAAGHPPGPRLRPRQRPAPGPAVVIPGPVSAFRFRRPGRRASCCAVGRSTCSPAATVNTIFGPTPWCRSGPWALAVLLLEIGWAPGARGALWAAPRHPPAGLVRSGAARPLRSDAIYQGFPGYLPGPPRR